MSWLCLILRAHPPHSCHNCNILPFIISITVSIIDITAICKAYSCEYRLTVNYIVEMPIRERGGEREGFNVQKYRRLPGHDSGKVDVSYLRKN
jgi:hypothetical protein